MQRKGLGVICAAVSMPLSLVVGLLAAVILVLVAVEMYNDGGNWPTC